MTVRIHWSLPLDSGQQSASGGFDAGVVDVDTMISFAREAEEAGVDSLLMPMSCYMPDPIPLLAALLRETRRVRFILAYRPGLMSPTLLTQVINTLACMGQSRVDLNLVAGISPQEQAYYGDFLEHDDRYRRADEFLGIMQALWASREPVTFHGQHYQIEAATLGLRHPGDSRPYIYVSGASAPAKALAEERADCWLCYGDLPAKVGVHAAPLLQAGKEVGLRLHVIARETREQALDAIAEMMARPDEKHRAFIKDFVSRCDSEAVKGSFRLAEQYPDHWPSPYLWTGAVPYRGGPAIAIVGSYQEVADYIREYERHGIRNFIFSGWPSRDEMRHFCCGVMPLLQKEAVHA